MKYENLSLKYSKALILGTGGGNDILSATLIADYLISNGMECDVAGILSPGALHTFDGKVECVINKLTGEVKRYIDSRDKVEITFIDSLLPSIIKQYNYKINNFYEFSTKYGTEKLNHGINKLISENKYDLFLEVDVGGDILARKKDKTILSPLMDFTSLYVLNKVNIDSYLVEFGLGTDGELRREGMLEILRELKRKKVLLSENKICYQDKEVQRFEKVFQELSTIRMGNTNRITLMTLKNENQKADLNLIYFSRFRIKDKIWKREFEVTIPKETFGSLYLFDGKKLPNLREKTAISYIDPLEQFIKIKQNITWKTELDLCFYDDIYFLTPVLSLPKEIRQEIIRQGAFELENDNARFIIILKADKVLFLKKYQFYDIGIFSIISKKKISDNNGLIKKIKKYYEK